MAPLLFLAMSHSLSVSGVAQARLARACAHSAGAQNPFQGHRNSEIARVIGFRHTAKTSRFE